jgi:hypothetical protein
MTTRTITLFAEHWQRINDALLDYCDEGPPGESWKSPGLSSAVAALDVALAQPEPTQDLSQLSDGYHTFAELYEHRHALCLALMRAIPRHCWFSLRHADGERCFGGNDWFIVGIEPPGGNSVTYHLPAKLYSAARATGAVELKKGRPWDGHTASDVVLRLKEWATLSQPEPEGGGSIHGLEGEIVATIRAHASVEPQMGTSRILHESVFGVVARAVLDRWGRPATTGEQQ